MLRTLGRLSTMQALLAGGLDLYAQRLMAPSHQCISLRNFNQFAEGLPQQRMHGREGRQGCVRPFAATAGKAKAKAKAKELFRCSECGETSPQKQGRCPSCKAWNTLETVVVREAGVGGGGGAAAARTAGSGLGSSAGLGWTQDFAAEPPASIASHNTPARRRDWVASQTSDRPIRLSDIRRHGFATKWRLPLAGPNGAELGRVLGGGVVPGSMILIGGDPGVGKSTLLLQVAGMLSLAIPANPGPAAVVSQGEDEPSTVVPAVGGDVLYVSGEESVEQIGSRAERMGLLSNGNVYLYSATRLEVILDEIVRLQPVAVIIDSIQTVYLEDVTGSAGSVSQVRECATALLHVAKQARIPIFLIGHVTKSGEIAGPRVLEHVVDVVLYMEGERQQSYRLLRSIKNRYGASDEVGVFAMGEDGLSAVLNPSELFLSERSATTATSSAVTVTLEGTRPLLLEVQGLCSPTHAGVPPVRVAGGVKMDRLHLILAVLGKHTAVKPFALNVHTNVVGGMSMREPSTDLAVAMAVAASYFNTTVPPQMAVIGELGLGGELRPVGHLDKRLMEAVKLGFTQVILPQPAPGPATEALKRIATRMKTTNLIVCRTVNDAFKAAFGSKAQKGKKKPGPARDDVDLSDE